MFAVLIAPPTPLELRINGFGFIHPAGTDFRG